MLFSATFAPSIEELARDILKDPVKITVGSHGAANEDVTQIVLVMDSDQDKWTWLITNIHRLVQEGSLLIFAGMKSAVDELSARLQIMNYTVAGIHGDKDFNERLKIMHAFKSGAVQIMVATDVAGSTFSFSHFSISLASLINIDIIARGLDVKSVKNVVNFAVARNIDDHVHRIGRTGRAGEKGVATTLILHKESDFAGKLVRNLEQANQIVPPELLAVAMRSPRFKVGRHTRGGKAGRGRGGARGGGLGFGRGGNRGDQGSAPQGPRPVHPEDQHRHQQGLGPQPGGYARDARSGFNRFVSSSEQYSSIGQGAPNAPRPQPSYEPPAGYVVDDYDPLNPTSDEAVQEASTPLNSEGKPMSLKEQFLAQFQGKLPFPPGQ
jgi:ATP-dependent RNA helicase DDX42